MMEAWENIPRIIPETFALYARQIEAVQRWITEQSKVKAPEVIVDRSHEVEERLGTMIDERLKLQANRIQELTEELERLAALQELSKRPQQAAVLIQTDLSGHALEQNDDLSDTDHSEDEDAGYKSRSRKSSQGDLEELLGRKVSVTNMLRPRMYSIEEIRKLFFKYLHRSKLKSQVLSNSEHVQSTLTEQVEDQEFRLNKVSDQLQTEFKRITEKVEAERKTLESVVNEVNSKFKILQDWSSKMEYRNTEVLVFAKALPDLQLKLDNTIERIDRLTGVVTQTQEKITETSKHVLDRAKSFVDESEAQTKASFKHLDSTLASLKTELELQQNLERKRIDKQLAETVDEVDVKIQGLLKDTQIEIQQQIADYRNIAEGDIEKYFQTLRKEQYDLAGQVKATQKEFERVKRDHDFWRTNVLEPSQITAARLFTVEARVKEEGVQRIETEQYLKDALKKLLFTLEQAQLNALAAKEIESDQNLTVFLKRLSFVKKLMDYTPAEIRPLMTKSRKLTTRKAMTAEDEGSSFMTQSDMRASLRK